MLDQLRALVTQLRFHGMEAALDAEIARAERGNVSAVDLLHRMLLEEAASKRQRSLAYRLAQAQMPWDWTLESFPFERLPGVDKRQIQTLAELDFLRRTDNVLLIGRPGTGKTGIALGLLRAACINGYRCRFCNAQTLLDELYASLADRSSLRLMKRLSRFQLLAIDELTYLTLKPEQIDMFFRLIDQRYGRASTIITSNLDLPAWYDMFRNKPLVDALLDRLQHRCVIIRIDGPSLRAPKSEPATTDPPPARATPAKATTSTSDVPPRVKQNRSRNPK